MTPPGSPAGHRGGGSPSRTTPGAGAAPSLGSTGGQLQGCRGRSLRGFQPGNKTERTNPASKDRITWGRRGSCRLPSARRTPEARAGWPTVGQGLEEGSGLGQPGPQGTGSSPTDQLVLPGGGPLRAHQPRAPQQPWLTFGSRHVTRSEGPATPEEGGQGQERPSSGGPGRKGLGRPPGGRSRPPHPPPRSGDHGCGAKRGL